MVTEARRYEYLAGVASAAGYRVSPSQVHHWVRRGLLPGAQSAPDDPADRAPEADAERQLLALLAHRRSTKSVARLLLLLWLDGWPIEPDHVRRALRDCLPQLPNGSLSEADRDRISRHAIEHALTLRRSLPPADLKPHEAAEVAEFFALYALGDRPQPSDELAPTISRAMGLDRAASDRVGDAEPWYDPSAGLAEVLQGFSLPELHALIDEVTDPELEAARVPARSLVHDFSLVVEALELAHGRGVSGLGIARTLGPRTVERALLAAIRAVRVGLLEALEQITATVASAPIQQVLASLPDARAWLHTHPERRRIVRIGLLAYVAGPEAEGSAPVSRPLASERRADSDQTPRHFTVGERG